VPDSAIVERITGRRLDPETGKIYHMKYKKPEDDTIAKRLITRSDDTVEKVR
jgi:adenylate kinase